MTQEKAMKTFKKAIIAIAAATTLAIGFAASATPAAAWGYGFRPCPPGYHLGYMGRYCHRNYWW
jgi:hypothetical protein